MSDKWSPCPCVDNEITKEVSFYGNYNSSVSDSENRSKMTKEVKDGSSFQKRESDSVETGDLYTILGIRSKF